MRPLFVLELNEVPLRVLRWHAERNPDSATARLLDDGLVGESLADEPLPRDLYPSQSWASLSTGVPFADHGVFWYNDPKPREFPMYWQAAAAAGVSTGIVGTLHSSPHRQQAAFDGIAFAIPDSFAADAATTPPRLSALQQFNLDLVRSNSRVVTSRHPVKKYAAGLGSLTRSGLGATAARELARLAGGVGLGRVPKERLRIGQFHLMADQFTRLGKSYDPQLSVLFSNHVASAMHRYWFASFPQDWDTEIYDESWRSAYDDEIPAALRALDLWLSKWMRWCRDTDRTLLLLSSMGQRGGADVDTSQTHALVLDDAMKFASFLGLDDLAEPERAMVPQISYRLGSEESARKGRTRIAQRLADSGVVVDQRADTLTVNYQSFPIEGDSVRVEGDWIPATDAGLRIHEVSEHRAAVHDPMGSIVVYNSATASIGTDPVDYLRIAPAILEFLGVDPLAHHAEPGLTI